MHVCMYVQWSPSWMAPLTSGHPAITATIPLHQHIYIVFYLSRAASRLTRPAASILLQNRACLPLNSGHQSTSRTSITGGRLAETRRSPNLHCPTYINNTDRWNFHLVQTSVKSSCVENFISITMSVILNCLVYPVFVMKIHQQYRPLRSLRMRKTQPKRP